MRKRVKIVLAVSLLAVIGLATSEGMRQPEPLYQGKRLSQWLDKYNQAGDKAWPPKTEHISDAIRAMGTNSLPFLLGYIKHRDAPIVLRSVDLARRQHLVRLPFYGDNPYRETSMMALHAMGSEAAPLLPELLKLSENPRTCDDGTRSLLAIGTTAIPTLAGLCQSTNVLVRFLALLTLAELKAAPPNHVWSRWKSAPVNGRGMLEFGGPEPDGTLGEILNLLESRDAPIRRASADTLGFIGRGYASGMAPITSALLKALNDLDPFVRQSAAATLRKLAPAIAEKAEVNTNAPGL